MVSGISSLLDEHRPDIESGILGVVEQLLLHQTSSSEQPGTNRTNRHAEHLGGRFVRLILHVNNNQRGAEWFRDSGQGVVDGGSEVQSGKEVLDPLAYGGR